MPTFLDDVNTPIFQDSTDLILDLDPDNRLGTHAVKHAEVDGVASLHHHPRTHSINEPFDEASYSTTSDASDPVPMTSNGNGTRPTSMSSLANGKPLSVGSDAHDAHVEPALPKLDSDIAVTDHALPNGISGTLPDRTVPRHPPAAGTTTANGIADAAADKKLPQLPSATPLASPSDTHPPPIDPNPADGRHNNSSSSDRAKSTVRAVPPDNAAPPSPPQLPPPPPPTSAPAADATPAKSPMHRLSSPPVYQTASSSTSTSHLHPPHPGSTLKQRHTLEVPKLPSGRPSRDGTDAAMASGRYSPTAAVSGTRRASLSLARRTTRSMQSDTPRDEIAPDEDAVRWAEAYRQKRASKRKRKEEEEDEDRVVVGTKVDESHANWVTAYNMLTGIRVSVSRTNAKLDRDLTDADFQAKQKSTFDIAGNELVPSAKYDFKFKDYAPWVFRHLRALFRLDPADYLMSLTGKYILSELGSPGKSGSFFYFSRDYKYIIKTIHHAEHKFLRKILKEYYMHVKENPNTLLSQFYGLHRVKLPYGKKIHFVVMNNLFPPHRDIHTTFDLKGSTIGRDYREEELDKNPRATLKDLNWLRRKRHLELGLQKKRLFLEQLQRDVVLLKRLQIMDYSLLVGIHDISRGNEENLRDKTLQVFNPGGEKSPEDDTPSVLLRTPSKMENARKARELRQMLRAEKPVPIGQALDKMPNELGEGQARRGFVFNQDDGGFRATHENNSPADEIYYLGVIDCLTHYGIIKKIEHFWKGLTSDRNQISALPPDQYGDRFYTFIEGVTMSSELAHREAQRLDEEMMAEEGGRSSHHRWTLTHHDGIPPMPNHQPPAPPPGGAQSPEAREVVTRASREAQRTEDHEKQTPERTLRTSFTGSEKRDSTTLEPILPVVEEAGENSRDDSDPRPRTPRKDKMLPPTRAPPPTPPKDASPDKPESADSGYGGGHPRLSKESLRNKTLPPLPQEGSKDGVEVTA